VIETGRPAPLGAHRDAGGVNFALHSPAAQRVELCFFDPQGRQIDRHDLPEQTDGIWHGYVQGCEPGQRYGYRIHGEFAPQRGLRFNPAKLLIDPYARALSGQFRWAPEVFDYRIIQGQLEINSDDSAAYVPKSVVVSDDETAGTRKPRIPWSETVLYEANVRGYTMRHPDVADHDRGRFLGMSNRNILDYLQALGITSIELMPVFEFVDEHFLQQKKLRNFWGYNTINFFSPAMRYANSDPRTEFRDMVRQIHDAGFEVILDVAYNHTGESGGDGPSLSFRGIDNPGYYRLDENDPGSYVNDTGTGNTVNVDNSRVRDLVIDSLRYWSTNMGVDGFRFDLATILGRGSHGFDGKHTLFATIANDPLLADTKLIAEPWDPGPGGYQLGQFPADWAEWNDRYRDSVRRFWRGDAGEAAEFAKRLHGSSDLFAGNGRGPCASVNFVTAHDGYTLADLVSFEHRHNEANGENNRDGHAHNYSHNYGVEGPTDDPDITAMRRQQRLNMLATLLLSQGTPMLLAGDEIGNSQGGNNNAYAQDNEIAWIDWSAVDSDPEFLEALRALIDLRHDIDLFRQPSYLHGADVNDVGWGDIEWLSTDGLPMQAGDWATARAFSVVLTHAGQAADGSLPAVVLLINGSANSERFVLPSASDADWQIRFVSAAQGFRPIDDSRWQLPAHSLVCVALKPHQATA